MLIMLKESEYVEHFLLRCERQPFLDKIYQSLQKTVGVGHFNRIRLNDKELTATILDCTRMIDDVKKPVLDIFLREVELTARGLCFALHLERIGLLIQSN